jgi:hypothetical protein
LLSYLRQFSEKVFRQGQTFGNGPGLETSMDIVGHVSNLHHLGHVFNTYLHVLHMSSVFSACVWSDLFTRVWLVVLISPQRRSLQTSPGPPSAARPCLRDDNDWITNCGVQAEFNELLEILRRNVAVMYLPDPSPEWE